MIGPYPSCSEGKHAKYHYMICGVQGDFTRGLVNDPPRTLWTRQLKFAGVSNTSTLYRRVHSRVMYTLDADGCNWYSRGIRVCTGTGLGAALSTCLQSPNWLVWSCCVCMFGPESAFGCRYLIWIGSDQEKVRFVPAFLQCQLTFLSFADIWPDNFRINPSAYGSWTFVSMGF